MFKRLALHLKIVAGNLGLTVIFLYIFSTTTIFSDFSVMGISEHQDVNTVLEYYVSGVGILLVSVVGVSGNIVSGVILKKRQRDTTQTFSDLLVWLAVIDTVFLVLVFLLFSLPHFSSHYSSWLLPYIAPVALPCSVIAMTG